MKQALVVVLAACAQTRGAPSPTTTCAVTPGDRLSVDEINTNAQLAFDGRDVAVSFVAKRTSAGPFVDVARMSVTGTRLATTSLAGINDAPVIASDATHSITCYRAQTASACVAVSNVTDTPSMPQSLAFTPVAIASGAAGFAVVGSADAGPEPQFFMQRLDDDAVPLGSPTPLPVQDLYGIAATATGFAILSYDHNASRIDRVDAQLRPIGAPLFTTGAYAAIAASGDELLLTALAIPAPNPGMLDQISIVHADDSVVMTSFVAPTRALPALSGTHRAVLFADQGLRLATVTSDGEVAPAITLSTDASSDWREQAIVGIPDGFLVAATAPNAQLDGAWDIATFHVACPDAVPER